MNKRLCNSDFLTEYAYMNDDKDEIHVEKYITEYMSNNINNCIKCINGHDLTCINGNINKHHFRHKNKSDIESSNITQWHLEWQSHFNMTEVEFRKINDKQIRNRRADILIEKHKIIIEIQHSYIETTEVMERKNDYELNNHKIYWILDGNEGITITKLTDINRTILEFANNKKWMYENFSDYNIIFINIKEKIYKINPNLVKSNMIDIENPIKKKFF